MEMNVLVSSIMIQSCIHRIILEDEVEGGTRGSVSPTYKQVSSLRYGSRVFKPIVTLWTLDPTTSSACVYTYSTLVSGFSKT